MIPGTRNLTLYRGDYFSTQISLAVEAVPLDLTDATVLAQIRTTPDGTDVLATFTETIVGDPTEGVILLELTGAETALLPVASVWDLQVTIDDKPETYLAGKVKCTKDVTREP